jgi:hypothetical protein
MRPQDDTQRVTAGELQTEAEAEAGTPKHEGARAGMTPEQAREAAERHRQAVAQGRAEVGEADPNAGQNAQDQRGTIHPSSG